MQSASWVKFLTLLLMAAGFAATSCIGFAGAGPAGNRSVPDLVIAQAAEPIKPQLQITEGEPGSDASGSESPTQAKPATKPANRSDAARAWDIVKDSTDTAVFDRFIEEFPGSLQAALAAQRRGELARAAPAGQTRTATPDPEPDLPKTPPPPLLSAEELALEVQKELARLGCNPGQPDGRWGGRSQAAAERFSQHAGITVNAQEPSPDMLLILQSRQGRVCPLVCAATENQVDGRCVAKTCPAGQRLSSKGNCYKPATAKTCKPGQRLSSKGRCYTPRAKRATAKKCRPGERLSSRGTCFVPRKKTATVSKPKRAKGPRCVWCERSNGQTSYVCGAKQIAAARSRGCK